MINKFVIALKDDLGLIDYIKEDGQLNSVVLGAENIANFDTSTTNINGKNLIITIVRIEEESTLKNFPNKKLIDVGGSYQVDKRYPKINLNYYLLFSATLQYDKSVAIINRTIKFFQANKKVQFEADGDNLELNLELYSPTFEQLNNIWGMLGGKQLPSIIYKVRVMALEKDEQKLGAVVKSIDSTIHHNE